MWLRTLALVFGVTVYAASAVLTSFRGGLALGSSGLALEVVWFRILVLFIPATTYAFTTCWRRCCSG